MTMGRHCEIIHICYYGC